jgi:hypothetical protein
VGLDEVSGVNSLQAVVKVTDDADVPDRVYGRTWGVPQRMYNLSGDRLTTGVVSSLRRAFWKPDWRQKR